LRVSVKLIQKILISYNCHAWKRIYWWITLRY
jgi:hypothetical protein